MEADASSVEQHAKHEVRSKSDQLQCSNQRLREWKSVAAWARSREHHARHEGDSKSAFARIFCDMYCIKDAVKQGDQAILVNLENAVSVLNQNFDSLLEYYTGGIADKLDTLQKSSQPPRLVQEDAKRMRVIMQGKFLEMKALAARGGPATCKSSSHTAFNPKLHNSS